MSREVLGRDEALAARTAHVLRLEDVDLRLGVPVEVRLRHALVAAQLAVELADTWQHRARRGVSGGRRQRGAASAGGGVSEGRHQRGAASAGGGVSGGRRQRGAASAGGGVSGGRRQRGAGAGVDSAPGLDFLANSNSDSRIGIKLELPPFESESVSELHSMGLDSESLRTELKSDTKSRISLSTVGIR